MNSWANTRIVKPIVRASVSWASWPSASTERSVNRPPARCMSMPISVTAAMMMPMNAMSIHISRSITWSVSLRGLRFMTSSVCGSTPMARAGAASVSRLIHSSCVASSGRVTPVDSGWVMPSTPASMTPPNTVNTSPTLELSR